MLLPSSAANPTSMIAQALTMYKNLVSDASTDGSQLKVSHAPSKSTKEHPSEETEGEILKSKPWEPRVTNHVDPVGFSLQDSKKKE